MDAAQKNCPSLELKVIARGEKKGWISFTREVERADENFPGPQERSQPYLRPYGHVFLRPSGMPKLACHDHAYALAHLFTAKHWQNEPNGLHLTVAETGGGRPSGVDYMARDHETAVFVMTLTNLIP